MMLSISISFLFLSKIIDINDCGENSTDEELEILVSSLKPGKKLPPLTVLFFYPANYTEQLMAENYL